MNQTKTVYSFPKGKINQGENGLDCAVREVWEEVGYDISKQIEEEVINNHILTNRNSFN